MSLSVQGVEVCLSGADGGAGVGARDRAPLSAQGLTRLLPHAPYVTDSTIDPVAARERVRRYYDLVDARDYDGLLALFADDVVYDRPGQGAIEGIDALERFYREERPLSEGDHALDAVVVDGDTAAVRGTFSGRQGETTVSFGFADFHTFDDGLIARRVTFTDRDEV